MKKLDCINSDGTQISLGFTKNDLNSIAVMNLGSTIPLGQERKVSLETSGHYRIAESDGQNFKVRVDSADLLKMAETES